MNWKAVIVIMAVYVIAIVLLACVILSTIYGITKYENAIIESQIQQMMEVR